MGGLQKCENYVGKPLKLLGIHQLPELRHSVLQFSKLMQRTLLLLPLQMLCLKERWHLMETRMGIQAKEYPKRVAPNLIEPQIRSDRLFEYPHLHCGSEEGPSVSRVVFHLRGERGRVPCHSSSSLEGGFPPLAGIIEDTEDLIKLQGLLQCVFCS